MPGIINSRQWLDERVRTLRAELEKDLPEAQRQAIEGELARLQPEADRNRRRWWRFLFPGARPPGP